jgi:hypothetical protein
LHSPPVDINLRWLDVSFKVLLPKLLESNSF